MQGMKGKELAWILSLTGASKTEFVLTILIPYQANKSREKRKLSIRGIVIDQVLNSPNLHY